MSISQRDVELINSMLPDFVEEANGIVFFGGDPLDELIDSIAGRFSLGRPGVAEVVKPLVKTVDGYLEVS